MSPTRKHLFLAQQARRHRKQFKFALIAVVLLGGFFGYLTGPYFAQFLRPHSSITDLPLNSWVGVREWGIAGLAIYSPMIWATVFAVIYFFYWRRQGAKLAAAVAIADAEARAAKEVETQRKIAEARARGEI